MVFFFIFFFSMITWYLVPRLEIMLGFGPVYILFALMAAGSIFFYKKYLIEPKGKTLEELERELLKVKPDDGQDQ